MNRKEITKLYDTVEEVIGLDRRTIKHYREVNWKQLCIDVLKMNKLLSKNDSRRMVKDYIYSIEVATDCRNKIWNAYVNKYMSHHTLLLVSIKDKYTNPYVDYRGMEI